MSTPPFVRFYANDWFTGCAGLKADERGVYVSMCVYVWTTGRRVPLDDAEASRMMNLNFKSYQRIRDRLVVIGKVTRHENGYGNDRAEHELAAATEAAAAKGRTVSTSDRSNEGRAPEAAESRQETAQNAQANGAILIDSTTDDVIDHRIDDMIEVENIERNQDPFIEPEPVTRKKNDVDDVRACDWKEVRSKLIEAAGDALASEAVAPGLANLSTPLWWIDEGADLERDILPAVAETCKRSKRKIVSWDYFTTPVTLAKAKRENRLPEVTAEMAASLAKPKQTERNTVARDLLNRINAGEFSTNV